MDQKNTCMGSNFDDVSEHECCLVRSAAASGRTVSCPDHADFPESAAVSDGPENGSSAPYQTDCFLSVGVRSPDARPGTDGLLPG